MYEVKKLKVGERYAFAASGGELIANGQWAVVDAAGQCVNTYNDQLGKAYWDLYGRKQDAQQRAAQLNEQLLERKDAIIAALRTTLGNVKDLAATELAPTAVGIPQQQWAAHKCLRIQRMATAVLNSTHTQGDPK